MNFSDHKVIPFKVDKAWRSFPLETPEHQALSAQLTSGPATSF